MRVKIAPSLLSADFGKLNMELKEVEKHADLLHVDVMDGHFVPNVTIGPAVVKSIKTKLPLDIHLMIENPEKYVGAFAESKPRIITIHAEACKNAKEVIKKIRNMGIKVGISINPSTPLSKITPVLGYVDMVLCMTVNPGFGGQKFIMPVLKKIGELRRLKPKLDIEVDGGINTDTIKLAVDAGANIIVAGSAIFGKKNRPNAIIELRKAIK